MEKNALCSATIISFVEADAIVATMQKNSCDSKHETCAIHSKYSLNFKQLRGFDVIVVDSGLGGFSVVRALRATQPDLALTYLADTDGFPYGKRTAEEIGERAKKLIRQLLALYPSTPIVIACNTLSTLCLSMLRESFPSPFVGTVPAIKTAAQISATRRFTLLATPNTAQSQYSQGLISGFASDCVVDVYGAPNLAMYAETMLLGQTVEDAVLQAELAPSFCDDAFGKTDCIVLGCTHYPLIRDALERVAPWPVTFIDSGDAIARRALSLHDTPPAESVAFVTSHGALARYQNVFAREGFSRVEFMPVV
jgi:glutamate racemase